MIGSVFSSSWVIGGWRARANQIGDWTEGIWGMGSVDSRCALGKEVGHRVAVRREVQTRNLPRVAAEKPRRNRSQPNRRPDRRGCRRSTSLPGDPDRLHHDLQRRGGGLLAEARLDVVRPLSRTRDFAVRPPTAVMDDRNRRGLRVGGGSGFQSRSSGPGDVADPRRIFDTLVEQVRERNPNAVTA